MRLFPFPPHRTTPCSSTTPSQSLPTTPTAARHPYSTPITPATADRRGDCTGNFTADAANGAEVAAAEPGPAVVPIAARVHPNGAVQPAVREPRRETRPSATEHPHRREEE